MPNYRVKAGKRFGPGGRYPAGTVLELTEAEARGFMDKLERVEDEPEPQQESQQEPPELQNELKIEVPEDLKLAPQDEPAEQVEEIHIAEEPAPAPKKAGKSHRKKATEG